MSGAKIKSNISGELQVEALWSNEHRTRSNIQRPGSNLGSAEWREIGFSAPFGR